MAATCLALDGLPLAVELAAARADEPTPAAISARLQNRFELLVEGGRELACVPIVDRPDVHQLDEECVLFRCLRS